MKTKLQMLLLAAVSVMIIACSPKEQPSSEILTGVSTPGAGLVIIKFADSGQLDYVIASHQLREYNGLIGSFVYDESGSMGLNISDSIDSNYTLNAWVAPFLESELHMSGASPYVRLQDDYYLVDWKWQPLLPISATCNYPQPDGNDILDAVKNHSFLTNVKWKNLNSLTTRWDQPNNFTPIQVKEIYRLNIKALEQFIGTHNDGDPTAFLCYNKGLYSDGLSVSNVITYWNNRSHSGCHAENAYLDCIAHYDSLQNVYAERLRQIIKEGALQELFGEKK